MFGLAAVVLIGLSRGACLSNTTLTALGFQPTAEYKPSTNNTYCTGVLQNANSCVNLTDIVAVTNMQKTAALGWENQNFTSALANATNAINDFALLFNTTLVTANVGKKLNGTTITEAHVSTGNTLSKLGSQFNNSTSSAALTTQVSNCIGMINTSMNGAYCLLISSVASDFTSVSATNVQINASADVPAPVVNQCLPLIFATCYLNSVAAYLDAFTGQTSAKAALTSACGDITTLGNCLTDNSACASSKPAMFKQFFTPTGSKIGGSLSTTFGDSIKAVRAFPVTATRMLAALATITSSYDVTAGGFNVVTTATGLASNSTSPKSASLYGLGLLFMLVALFLN